MIGSKHLFKAVHKNRLPIIDYQNNVPGIELFLLGTSAICIYLREKIVKFEAKFVIYKRIASPQTLNWSSFYKINEK